MNFENSNDNNGNSYSYSYTYITNQITDSFNTRHKNSHNGHGRGAVGCLLPVVLVLAPIGLLLWFVFSLLGSWLT